MEPGGSAGDQVARLAAEEAILEARLQRLRRRKQSWQAGQVGEERIAALLGELPPGWRVLHDRRKSPRSPANIDHIAIGPTGVYVIDAKNWTGGLQASDRGVVCGGWPRNDETRTVAELATLVQSELELAAFHVPVYGVIALAREENTAVPFFHEGVAFLPPQELIAGLTRSPLALTPDLVYRVWEFLDDTHPSRTSVAPVGRAAVASSLTPPSSRKHGGRRRAATTHRPNRRRKSKGPSLLGLGLALAVLYGMAHMKFDTTATGDRGATQTGSPPVVTKPVAVTACSLLPASVSAHLLGRPVTAVAISPQLCEYKMPSTRRPLAIVAYGPSLTSQAWTQWLTSLYGVTSCGRYTVIPSGAAVGACVDAPATDARAWRFDDAVVRSATARG